MSTYPISPRSPHQEPLRRPRLALGLCAVLALLAPAPVTAQVWSWWWMWAAGDGGAGDDRSASVATDAAGNALVTGSFTGSATFGSFVLTSAGDYDVFVAKYAPTGAVLWAARAGASFTDQGLGVAVDAAGNAYVTGTFRGTAAFGPFTLTSAGEQDLFLVKYDPGGTVLWARRHGGPLNEMLFGDGVAVDAAGDAYVTGGFTGTADVGPFTLTSVGNSDALLAKFAPDGTVLWAERAGGIDFDISNGVAVDAAGNAHVAGVFRGTAAFGPFTVASAGNLDAYLARYAPDGTALGAWSGGGSGIDRAFEVAVDADGNALVSGLFGEGSGGTAAFGPFTLTSAGLGDAFLAKFAPDGSVLWARRAGGPNEDSGRVGGVDADGSIYLAGTFWATADVGPFTLTSPGFQEAFLAKVASDGTVLWAERAGGPFNDYGADAAVAGPGRVVFNGSYGFVGDLGPFTLLGAGQFDVFLAQLDGRAPVAVTAVPVDPPVVIGPGGGAFDFTVTLTNTTTQQQTVEAWAAVEGALSHSPVLGPRTVVLPPGGSETWTLTQQVPAGAPAGVYTYHARGGPYPVPVASAGFAVVKEGAARVAPAPAGAGTWAVEGWDEGARSGATASAGGLSLSEPYPNPSRGRVHLTLELPEAAPVRAEVLDALGRRVATLHEGDLPAGTHPLAFDGGGLPPGVYVVRVTGARLAVSRTLALAR